MFHGPTIGISIRSAQPSGSRRLVPVRRPREAGRLLVLPFTAFPSLPGSSHPRFPPVSRPVSSTTVVAALMTSIVLWGANNVFVKLLLQKWPPLFTGSTRFLIGGILLAGLLRWIPGLRPRQQPTAVQKRELWLRGAIVLSFYNVACNWCLLYIPASHFALHLAASPVWALLWEEGLRLRRHALPRYAAAGLTLAGVFVLLIPALTGSGHWFGEVLGLIAGILWTAYNQECRRMSKGLSGLQITSGTVWRAGLILLPPASVEVWTRGPFALTPGLQHRGRQCRRLRLLELGLVPLAGEPRGALGESHPADHDGRGRPLYRGEAKPVLWNGAGLDSRRGDPRSDPLWIGPRRPRGVDRFTDSGAAWC
jgi:drug/metabolite transporter (DMT)-like permease